MYTASTANVVPNVPADGQLPAWSLSKPPKRSKYTYIYINVYIYIYIYIEREREGETAIVICYMYNK